MINIPAMICEDVTVPALYQVTVDEDGRVRVRVNPPHEDARQTPRLARMFANALNAAADEAEPIYSACHGEDLADDVARPEPAPTPTDQSKVVLDGLLAEDDHHRAIGMRCMAGVRNALIDRAQFGLEKYRVPLMSHNGRDARNDLLQEILDAIMYAEQDRMESRDRGGSEEFASKVVEDLTWIASRILFQKARRAARTQS